MTQFRMDDNDDLAIENNRFVLTPDESDEEIRQRLLQALRFFLAEWFLDTSEGLPYFQAIFVKGTPPDLIETEFKEAIIDVQGVVFLERFDPLDYDPGTRKLSVNFDVKTVNSTTLTINQELP